MCSIEWIGIALRCVCLHGVSGAVQWPWGGPVTLLSAIIGVSGAFWRPWGPVTLLSAIIGVFGNVIGEMRNVCFLLLILCIKKIYSGIFELLQDKTRFGFFAQCKLRSAKHPSVQSDKSLHCMQKAKVWSLANY